MPRRTRHRVGLGVHALGALPRSNLLALTLAVAELARRKSRHRPPVPTHTRNGTATASDGPCTGPKTQYEL
jgi:hypothetical protein